MKKTITKLLLVFFLMVIYAYTLAIENIPDKLVIFEGENIAIKTLLGMQTKIDSRTMETSSTGNISTINKKTGKASVEVSLFNNISLKNIDIDVLPKAKVIPVRKYSRSKIVYKWCISSRNV